MKKYLSLFGIGIAVTLMTACGGNGDDGSSEEFEADVDEEVTTGEDIEGPPLLISGHLQEPMPTFLLMRQNDGTKNFLIEPFS